MADIFDSTIRVLGRSLDLRAERQKLLSSNIANQETPGYRARDIKFEDEMKKHSEVQGSVLVRTNPTHMGPIIGTNGAQPLDRATEIEGYDRNSVGLDSEMSRLSENSLMYTVSTKMLRAKFGILMTAIKEGR